MTHDIQIAIGKIEARAKAEKRPLDEAEKIRIHLLELRAELMATRYTTNS